MLNTSIPPLPTITPNNNTTTTAVDSIVEPLAGDVIAELLHELDNEAHAPNSTDTSPNTTLDLAALVADLGTPEQFIHGINSDTETASEND